MPKMDVPNMAKCNRSITSTSNAGAMTMTCN
jgi:hypothetical protein